MADFLSLPELLDAVRAYCAANWIGLTPEKLTVTFLYGPPSLELPLVGIAARPVAPSAREQEPAERGRGLSRCVTDILAMLREAGRPLTTTRLLEEMWKKGREWSERHVSNHLKALMDDGTLENPKGARPPGYRLTDSADPGATS